MSGYAGVKKWREAFKLRDPEGLRAIRREEARKYRLAHPDKCKEFHWRHREKNIDAIRKQDAEAHRKLEKTILKLNAKECVVLKKNIDVFKRKKRDALAQLFVNYATI